MDARSVGSGQDAQERSGDCGEDADRKRMAAQPVHRTAKAEKTVGGGGKYFRVSARLAN